MVIGAVVLAAGQSKRMGRPKLVLPWEEETIIARVVSTLNSGGVEDIVVVTGSAREAVIEALQVFHVTFVHNPEFRNDDMVWSLSIGLERLQDSVTAALVVLGDQPQIQPGTVRRVGNLYRQEEPHIIIPSYQRRRGHPWLLDRQLWSAVRDLPAGNTLRDFLDRHTGLIRYLNVNTPSVLHDIDTPDDYQSAIDER